MNDVLPFRLVVEYDRMRLAMYRKHGSCGRRISIRSVEHTLLLRFADVGYFNTVYGDEGDVKNRLSEVERFFHGSPYGCRLVTPSLSLGSPLADACALRGWIPDHEYVWLSAETRMLSSSSPHHFEIRTPRADEHDLFVSIYLRAFGADKDRMPAAIRNMRHLFSNPHLHFLFAFENDQPVGVGMMYVIGRSALLCAGAMLPSSRGCGGHQALLAARIRLAQSLGCTDIHSWAFRGSSSHRNIEQSGLRTVRTSLALRLPPEKLA
jgi:hypothetical protein